MSTCMTSPDMLCEGCELLIVTESRKGRWFCTMEGCVMCADKKEFCVGNERAGRGVEVVVYSYSPLLTRQQVHTGQDCRRRTDLRHSTSRCAGESAVAFSSGIRSAGPKTMNLVAMLSCTGALSFA